MPFDSIDVWRDEDGPRFTDEDFDLLGEVVHRQQPQGVSLAATQIDRGRGNRASGRACPAAPKSGDSR